MLGRWRLRKGSSPRLARFVNDFFQPTVDTGQFASGKSKAIFAQLILAAV